MKFYKNKRYNQKENKISQVINFPISLAIDRIVKLRVKSVYLRKQRAVMGQFYRVENWIKLLHLKHSSSENLPFHSLLHCNSRVREMDLNHNNP